MTFVKDLNLSPAQTDLPFADRVNAPNAQKSHNGTRQLIAKHITGVRHAVNLRINQLQNATHKSHKPGKRERIIDQLHDLTAYQGMLNSLAHSLDTDDHSVCYQTYLSSVAHVTSRIFDEMHEHPHDEHRDVEFNLAALPVHENATVQELEAREMNLMMLLNIGYELQEQNKEVQAATKDFGRAIKVSVAPKKGMTPEGDAVREAAKESLRAEVTEEVKAEAAAEGIKMDAKAEDNIVHRAAWERWQVIKENAAKIHGVAVEAWNNRDEHIARMRAKLREVHHDMVQPHLDRWHATAQEHAETFSASIEQMNRFAGSLNSAIESYPSSEVQSLEALHSHVDELSAQCGNCANTLTSTLDLLHQQHDNVVTAKEAVIGALKGDMSGLEKAAKVLNLDQMKKLYSEIGEFHEKHLPGMSIATQWLKQTVDDLHAITSVFAKDKGKGGPDGNAYSA